MQAGESLKFISIPDELAVKAELSECERRAAMEKFCLLHSMLFENHEAAFDSLITQEELGPVVVSEGSFQVQFDDGSYLHVVAYSHTDAGGVLDLGLSIVEHTNTGEPNGGYLYELSGSSFRYGYFFGNDMDGLAENDELSIGPEMGGIPSLEHFSIIENYKRNDQLRDMMLSDDQVTRELAEITWQQIEETATLASMDRELGFSFANPAVEDVEKLIGLVPCMVPFQPTRT